MKYLLDTNTLIYFFKGQGKVGERLLQHSPRAIAVPSIVLYELETGLARSHAPEKRRRQLGELLAVVEVFPFGIEEARAGGRIRAELEAAGEPIGPYDTLIAATALANRAVLVTRNAAEFSRITGLAVENWHEDAE